MSSDNHVARTEKDMIETLNLFGDLAALESVAGRSAAVAGARPTTTFTRPDGVVITAHYSSHVCDARCMYATGHQCDCSCGGKNHGVGNLRPTAFFNA